MYVLLGIVKHQSQCSTRTRVHHADTMSHRGSRPPTRTLHRSIPRGEDQRVTLLENCHRPFRLGARPLFHEQELAADVVDARSVEPDHDLQGKHQLSVQVPMQCIPVTRSVGQKDRGRAILTGVVTLIDPFFERIRPRCTLAQLERPLPRHGQEVSVEGGSHSRDRLRYGITEVPVLPLSETVSSHVDGAPEPVDVRVPGSNFATFRLVEYRRRLGTPTGVDSLDQRRPIEGINSSRQIGEEVHTS